MAEERKRRWGDRKDGYRVKLPGIQTIMGYILPKRTECEVYLHETIDATAVMAYLEEKNASHPEYKTTIFHCAVVALARMLMERPQMNYFVQGYHTYERKDISLAFVAKRRFADGADESMMMLKPKPTDTLDVISHKIYGDVREVRKHEHAEDGIDKTIDTITSLPSPLVWLIAKTVHILDFWGKCPDFLVEGNLNYASILLSNLGSIKCPAVYHHLNNYGTNSVMITLGTLHKEEMVMPDGHKEVRDVIDVGATIDERIGDGFYFARSLKLVKHIFEHPELLDQPLGEPSGFDYK
ncbi:MAG: 2-oxo acid dehydrogenase subunit E2 [Lachnospiraceae bacterium]|nr:2-oxo acid dehydrogenase subunit E2 [Lachnospiraceae bacterium]